VDSEEIMLITNQGMLIRMRAKQISVIGRVTQGVRLIALESSGEQVVAAARVAETSHEADEAGVRENGGAGEPVAPAEDEAEGPGEPEEGGEPEGGGGA